MVLLPKTDESEKTAPIRFQGTLRPTRPAEIFFPQTPAISPTFDIYANFDIFYICHIAR